MTLETFLRYLCLPSSTPISSEPEVPFNVPINRNGIENFAFSTVGTVTVYSSHRATRLFFLPFYGPDQTLSSPDQSWDHPTVWRIIDEKFVFTMMKGPDQRHSRQLHNDTEFSLSHPHYHLTLLNMCDPALVNTAFRFRNVNFGDTRYNAFRINTNLALDSCQGVLSPEDMRAYLGHCIAEQRTRSALQHCRSHIAIEQLIKKRH